MEHRRQPNKNGSPTFLQLHASNRTEPHINQNGDHATESSLTTQVLLLKSLESNGDRRNYLSSWGENVERRLAVVSEGIRRSDLWIGATAMSEPVWMLIDNAHLASQLQWASTLRWAPTPQGVGVNRDWLACTPDHPPISECSAGKHMRPISCEQTGRQYCFIDIDFPWVRQN